jgi:hypothetical protein
MKALLDASQQGSNSNGQLPTSSSPSSIPGIEEWIPSEANLGRGNERAPVNVGCGFSTSYSDSRLLKICSRCLVGPGSNITVYVRVRIVVGVVSLRA